MILFCEMRSEQLDRRQMHCSSTQPFQNKWELSANARSKDSQISLTVRHPQPTPTILEHRAETTLAVQLTRVDLTQMQKQLSAQRPVSPNQPLEPTNELNVRNPTHFVQRMHHDEAPVKRR
jgi:hypothetical protein